MPFQEGAEVKKGDLLFVVDPRPYKAQLDQAQGQVNLYKASLKLARVTLARDRAINTLSPGSISQQQFDQEQAVVDEAEARVKAYEKSMEIYNLQHDFTRVTSPIDGMISRYYLTLGNLVNQDSTLLTTVVSVDPMYAYFEMDEPTLLRTRRAINEGKIRLPKDGKLPVLMGLQGEDGFPHQGTINFVNNQVNPTTGSILVRGIFANPRPDGRPAAALAGDVRADPPADRPAAPGAAGHRPGHRVGPGDEVRLRHGRRGQGPVPPRHDRGAPGRRPPRHREGPRAGRLGRRRRVAAGPPAHQGPARARGHAHARPQRTGREHRPRRPSPARTPRRRPSPARTPRPRPSPARAPAKAEARKRRDPQAWWRVTGGHRRETGIDP